MIASKFGNLRAADGSPTSDGRPEYVKACCERSLRRLEIDVIDLYYVHRVDPTVPIEDTVGAMGDLVRQGKVHHLGICEAGAATIRRAHATHPLSEECKVYAPCLCECNECCLLVVADSFQSSGNIHPDATSLSKVYTSPFNGIYFLDFAGFVVMGLTLTLNRMGQAGKAWSIGLMTAGTALVFIGLYARGWSG